MSDSLAPGETGGLLVSAYQLPPWVWPAVLVGVCAIAVWRGGDEERLGAGTILLGWSLSSLVFKAYSEETQWAMLAIDAAEFAVFLWLALRSRRYWTLFVAAFKLLIVITHIAHALDNSVSGWAYLTAVLLWSYLSLYIVGYAAWTAPNYKAAIATPAPGATRR
jgi:hypothetical protein